MTLLDLRDITGDSALSRYFCAETSVTNEVESFLSVSVPVKSFLKTQTDSERFFCNAVEVGLMDAKGNCLIDDSQIGIPSLSEAVFVRLNNRLKQKLGKIEKNLNNLPNSKLAAMKQSFKNVSNYCLVNGITNPFKIDFKECHAEIQGLDICLLELFPYLLETVERKISSIEVIGGDLPDILGYEFVVDVKNTLEKICPRLVFNSTASRHFQKKAKDLDIRINYPCNDYDELKNIDNIVIDYLARQFGELDVKEIAVDLRCIIRELAFTKLQHVYRHLDGRIDNFYIISLADIEGMDIDLIFVDTQVRKQLFHANGLTLNIMPSLVSDDPLVPRGEVCAGWQAILDRLCGIAAISDSHLPIDHGWSRLLSTFVRGNRCVNASLENRLLSDVLPLSAIQIVEEIDHVVRDHNNGAHEALFSVGFMLSSFLIENGISELFVVEIWHLLKGRLDFSIGKGEVEPICKIATEVICKNELSFADVSAIMQVIYSLRMALPDSGVRRERLMKKCGENTIRVAFCENVILTLPFKLEKSLATISKLLETESKNDVLKFLERGISMKGLMLDSPSTFSLYVNFESFQSEEIFNEIEKWNKHGSEVLERVSLGLNIAFTEVNYKFLTRHFEQIGHLLFTSAFYCELIPYFFEIDRKYASLTGRTLFHSFIDEFQRHLSGLTSQRKYSVDLNSWKKKLNIDFFKVLVDTDHIEINTTCYHLWLSIQDTILKGYLGKELIFLMQNKQPVFALKILVGLLKIEHFDFKSTDWIHQTVSKIIEEVDSNDVLRYAHKVISCLFSCGPPLKKNKFRLYSKVSSFLKVVDYLLERRGPFAAYEFLVAAIHHQIIENSENVNKKLLDLLQINVQHSAPDFMRLNRLFSDESKDIFNSEIDKLRYRQYFSEATQKLSTDRFHQAIAQDNFIEAKNEFLKLISDSFFSSELKETVMIFLKFLVKAERIDDLHSILSHPRIPQILQNEERQEFSIELVRLSELDSMRHLSALGMSLEFVSDEKYLGLVLPYLMRQLESIPLQSLCRTSIDNSNIGSRTFFEISEISRHPNGNYPLEPGINEGIGWSSFKSLLHKNQRVLFETLSKGEYIHQLFQLAHYYHLWAISLDKSVSIIIDTLVVHWDKVSKNIAYNIIGACLKTFEKRIVETAEDIQLAGRFMELFNLPSVKQRPLLANRLLVAVNQLPFEKEILYEKVYEQLSFLIIERKVEEVDAITLLLQNFTMKKTQFWSELLPGLLDRLSEGFEKNRMKIIVYYNGVDSIEGNQELSEDFLHKLIRLRGQFRKGPLDKNFPEEILKYDAKLLSACAEFESFELMVNAFSVFVDVREMVLLKAEQFLNVASSSTEEKKTVDINFEGSLNHSNNKEITVHIHTSVVAFLLRCLKFQRDVCEGRIEITKNIVLNLLRYVKGYCLNRNELLTQICQAFPETCDISLLYEYRFIFFRLIENPTTEEIPMNNPVYLRIFNQVLTMLVCCDHYQILTHPHMSRFFDSEQILELWVVYITSQIDKLNINKPEDSVLFFGMTLQNIHLFKSNETLLSIVLEKLWNFATFMEYFVKGNLGYSLIFNETMVVLFSDFFHESTSSSLKIKLMKNPYLKTAVKGNRKGFVKNKKLNSKKIKEASQKYFQHKHQLCMQLMNTDAILALVNEISRVSREIVLIDTDKEVDFDALTLSLQKEPLDDFEFSRSFIVRYLDFIKLSIMEMIEDHCHNQEKLVELVVQFVFLKLPLENSKTVFTDHLNMARDLFEKAVKKNIFITEIAQICKCLTYCNVYNSYVVINTYCRNQVSLTLKMLFESSCFFKLIHTIQVLFSFSETLYVDYPKEFIDIFEKLLVIVKENYYFECNNISTLNNLNTVETANLYPCVGIQMIRDGKFIFSNNKNEDENQTTTILVEMYVNALFEIVCLDHPAKIDFQKDHTARFLCEYLIKAKSSGGYVASLELLHEHVRRLGPYYLSYLDDPRVVDKNAAYKIYEKLLFISPDFRNIHGWILALLQSEIPIHIERGKFVFSKALRAKLYLNHPDKLSEITSCIPK